MLCLLVLPLAVSAQTGTALVRHAPTLNGRVEGSVQVMTAENVTLNGGAYVEGDLLLPGTPTVQLNGNPTYGGTLDGTGAVTPASHKVTLNGGANLSHVVRRTDAVALPMVVAPPQPTGTRSVSLNNPGESLGDFATLKNLTLNSNVGQIAVPPGTYGSFGANAGSGFALGIAGAVSPAVYNFQNLTLNSNSSFTVVGPVIVTVEGGFSTNANMGAPDHPEWLKLRIAGGGLSVSGNRTVYAHLEAPDGTLTLNGGAQFAGLVASDRLIVNGNALLRLLVPATVNLPPIVALTSPADGAGFTAPASLNLIAVAADTDGNVARVEFYSGAVKLGEDSASPYELAVVGLAAGSHTYVARAIDNEEASTDSASITVNVASANQPPNVVLTAPTDGALYTAPVALALAATATDADGSVVKVEFHQESAKLGEDLTAPYEVATGSLAPGTYALTATAYDNLGSSGTSPAVTITVVAPNEAPSVVVTFPANGTNYTAPAAFTLSAFASDADGTITKVEFFQDNILLGADVSAPFEWAVTGLTAGSYNFLARATDNAGSATDASAVSITVSSPVDLSLSFVAGFETVEGYTLSALHGQMGWVASSQTIVTNADHATGTQSVLVPGNNPPLSLSRSFEDHPGQSVVFVDLSLLPFAAADETSSAVFSAPNVARVAFVRDGSAGRLSAYDGATSTWQRVGGLVSLDADGFAADWTRLSLRLDFSAAEWDLFVGGRMVAAKLGFSTPIPTSLNTLSLLGHSTSPTLIDDVLAAFENPLFADADLDGMDDTWEVAHGLNPSLNDRDADPDNDGLSNVIESILGTNPSSTDSDSDGLKDGEERLLTTNPLASDTDGDGLPDGWEKAAGLDPRTSADASLDGDGDGLTNLQEYQQGKDPNDYYNGVLPEITSLVGASGELGPGDTLQLKVTNAAGQPMVNAPVTFVAQSGGHQLAASVNGPALNTITVRTGEDGIAKVYVRGGSN